MNTKNIIMNNLNSKSNVNSTQSSQIQSQVFPNQSIGILKTKPTLMKKNRSQDINMD